MDIVEEVIRLFLAHQQPWWVYVLILLIPICMVLAAREFMCWFWKVNKLINRIERLEDKLNSIKLGSETPPVRKFNRKASTPRKQGPTEL